MPHVIVTAAASLVLRDIVEIGRRGQVPVLRFVRMTGGDAVVLAPPSGARIDGRPMLGGLAVIDRGAGALVREIGNMIFAALAHPDLRDPSHPA